MKTKYYSFSDFRDIYEIDKTQRTVDKMQYALYLANPLVNPFNIPTNNKITMPTIDKVKDLEGMGNPLDVIRGNININQLNGLNIESVNDFLFYCTHPTEFLKIILQMCVDLGFATASIVAIVALCMYVFTGCKDKKPLQYVGLAVACYYVVAVILNAFIYLV